MVRITGRSDDKFMVGKLDTSVLFTNVCLVLSIRVWHIEDSINTG